MNNKRISIYKLYIRQHLILTLSIISLSIILLVTLKILMSPMYRAEIIAKYEDDFKHQKENIVTSLLTSQYEKVRSIVEKDNFFPAAINKNINLFSLNKYNEYGLLNKCSGAEEIFRSKGSVFCFKDGVVEAEFPVKAADNTLAHLNVSRKYNISTWAPYKLILFSLVSFILLILLLSLFLARQFWKKIALPIEQVMGSIKEIKDIKRAKRAIDVIPVKELYGTMNTLLDHQSLLINTQIDLEKANTSKKIGAVASQVAHDIRSPLSSLQAISSVLKGIPENQRVLIRRAVQRINDIANDLNGRNYNKNKDYDGENKKKSVCLISAQIDSLVTEKRMEYRSNMNIEITTNLNRESYGLFSEIQSVEFKRLLSNLINNAVQAFNKSHKGEVIVALKDDGDRIKITVSDNGNGIPAEILSKLGKEGATFGKRDGQGLGLFHAKKNVEECNGVLEIKSGLGIGTDVIITLPKSEAPEWFVSKLVIGNNTCVVVIDDDDSIHQVWDTLFAELKIKPKRVEHFSNSHDVLNMYKNLKATDLDFLFLCDYELLDDSKTGLDIIEENDIAMCSVLVTSHYENESIRSRCQKLGAKILPKNLAGFIPIKTTEDLTQDIDENVEYDAILIDDQRIVRNTWETVAKIKAFSHPDEFFKVADRIRKGSKIYIDSNLSDNLKGELVAKDIKKLGFNEIYLATGVGADEFEEDFPWITEIRDKMCPFLDG